MGRDFSLTSIFMQLGLPKIEFLFPLASGRGNLQPEKVYENLTSIHLKKEHVRMLQTSCRDKVKVHSFGFKGFFPKID